MKPALFTEDDNLFIRTYLISYYFIKIQNIMLKRQFGTSSTWITALLHFKLLKELENNNATDMTKSKELSEDTNHLTKSADLAYATFLNIEFNQCKILWFTYFLLKPCHIIFRFKLFLFSIFINILIVTVIFNSNNTSLKEIKCFEGNYSICYILVRHITSPDNCQLCIILH